MEASRGVRGWVEASLVVIVGVAEDKVTLLGSFCDEKVDPVHFENLVPLPVDRSQRPI